MGAGSSRTYKRNKPLNQCSEAAKNAANAYGTWHNQVIDHIINVNRVITGKDYSIDIINDTVNNGERGVLPISKDTHDNMIMNTFRKFNPIKSYPNSGIALSKARELNTDILAFSSKYKADSDADPGVIERTFKIHIKKVNDSFDIVFKLMKNIPKKLSGHCYINMKYRYL